MAPRHSPRTRGRTLAAVRRSYRMRHFTLSGLEPVVRRVEMGSGHRGATVSPSRTLLYTTHCPVACKMILFTVFRPADLSLMRNTPRAVTGHRATVRPALTGIDPRVSLSAPTPQPPIYPHPSTPASQVTTRLFLGLTRGSKCPRKPIENEYKGSIDALQVQGGTARGD